MPRQSKQKPARQRVPHQINLLPRPQTIGRCPSGPSADGDAGDGLILDHADKIRVGLLTGDGDDR